VRILRQFKEFLEKGIVRRQKPDYQRAESLVLESDDKYNFFVKVKNKMGFEELNTNYIIETCYDVLIELIRAKLLSKGYNSDSSHEAEVAYLREICFNNNEVNFMNDLRYFRNGIKYYGKILKSDYAVKVLAFMEKARRKLKEENKKDEI
jgi:hypothetical protein